MRNAWLAALLALGLLAGGWILSRGPNGPGEQAFTSVLAQQAEAALTKVKQVGKESAAEADRDTGTFYRYTDASGSVHFVSSLADVPRAMRERAAAVSNDRVQHAAAAAPRRARPGPAKRNAEERMVQRAAEHEVVVYTTSWCGWCRKTLAFLTKEGVPYENRDIEANDMWRDELEEKTGSTSIPVVEIDGELIRGYNPARMQELLESS